MHSNEKRFVRTAVPQVKLNKTIVILYSKLQLIQNSLHLLQGHYTALYNYFLTHKVHSPQLRQAAWHYSLTMLILDYLFINFEQVPIATS